MGVFSKSSKAVATGAACASAACVVGATVVPESMKVTSVMKAYNWGEVPLEPIDFNIGVQLLAEQKASDIIQKHTGSQGSIAFVETSVDDAGLEEFHKDFFPFPLYKDESLKFYQALGDASITENISYNPFRAFTALRAHMRRHSEKNISGNMKGEGLKKGGLIIFGKDGSPQFMVQEQTGSLIDEDELLAALEAVRKGDKGGAEL